MGDVDPGVEHTNDHTLAGIGSGKPFALMHFVGADLLDAFVERWTQEGCELYPSNAWFRAHGIDRIHGDHGGHDRSESMSDRSTLGDHQRCVLRSTELK